MIPGVNWTRVDCDTAEGLTKALERAVMLGERDGGMRGKRTYREIQPELRAKTRGGHERALMAAYSTAFWNVTELRAFENELKGATRE